MEFIKDNYQNNEDFILQYGCSICGTVFDTKELCDNHLKNCENSEHGSRSETSTYTKTDQTTNEVVEEDSYLENVINVDDLHESDKYLYEQNSELDKNYGITSKMISDNEIFITLPYAQGAEYTEKVIDYCDDMTIGVEKNTQECETEYKFQLSTKNANTKTFCNIGKTDNVTHNTNKRVIITNQHVFVTKLDVSKEPARENEVDYHENIIEDRNLSNFYQTVKQSMPNNTSTWLSSVAKDKNHISKDIGQSLKQCGEHNTKLEAKESKKGILYKRLYASKEEVKRKRQKHMKTYKRKKSQKEMQILIEKTKQSLNNANCNSFVDHNTENGDTSQCQKTNRMYTVINTTKEELSEESDDQGELKVYEFFDEEEEKIKKHLQKQRERKKEENKKICCYCQKTFENPMDVLRHKREAHKFKKVTLSREEIESYLDKNDCKECPLCSKALNGYRSVYVRHIMTHCDEYNYKCRICGQAFRRGDHCEAHEKRHVVQ